MAAARWLQRPSLSAAALVLLWALYIAALLAPEGSPLLAQLPSRFWALLPPALLVCLVCSYGAVYGALAVALAPPLDATCALWDAHSQRPALAPSGLQGQREPVIPGVGDLPITLVNKAQLLCWGK